MVKRFITFLKTPASINIFINTAGNYLSVLFTAFFVVILTRILTVADYGTLNVLLAIAYVMANVLDLGTPATIYSYLPPLLHRDRNELYQFVKSTFVYQSFFSALLVAVLIFIFPWVDEVFFKTGSPYWHLMITAISILFLVWQNFITNIYNAAQKFLKANIYANISNSIKAVLLISMALMGISDIGILIIVMGIIGPLVFFVLVFYDRQHVLKQVWQAPYSHSELRVGYTLTYFIATQLFTVGSRMDLFLLSHFSFMRTREEVGYYALAQKIILTIITTVVSITQVLSPGFSNIKTKAKARSALKQGFVYMLLPSALFVILYFTPVYLFKLVFTTRFAGQTVEITRQLALPFIIYALGSIPMLFLLYTAKKPTYILISNALFFVIMTLGCYSFIPADGVFAPPMVILVALSSAVVIQVIAAVYEYRKLPAV